MRIFYHFSHTFTALAGPVNTAVAPIERIEGHLRIVFRCEILRGRSDETNRRNYEVSVNTFIFRFTRAQSARSGHKNRSSKPECVRCVRTLRSIVKLNYVRSLLACSNYEYYDGKPRFAAYIFKLVSVEANHSHIDHLNVIVFGRLLSCDTGCPLPFTPCARARSVHFERQLNEITGSPLSQLRKKSVCVCNENTNGNDPINPIKLLLD